MKDTTTGRLKDQHGGGELKCPCPYCQSQEYENITERPYSGVGCLVAAILFLLTVYGGMLLFRTYWIY